MIGPVSDAQKKLAITLGIVEQVNWKGQLSYKEVSEQMKLSDALVHFSNYENLRCVINEALCCGLPVISSNVGGISELITNRNGILVPAEDEHALSKALESYITSFSKYNKMEISDEASKLFNFETIGKQILSVYNQALKLSKIN